MKTASLAEVAEVVMGQSPPGSSYNDRGIGIPLLNGPTEFGPNGPTAKQWTTEPKRFAKPGDILFCVRGATAGRMNWSNGEYAIGRGLAAIRGRETDPGYLYRLLDTWYQLFQARGTGSTFINISKKDLHELPIPLPPIEEQRRIAAVLDAADELRAKRRRALAKLDTLTQAIFIDMFGDPTKFDGPACRLTDVADLQIGYPFKSSTFTGTEEGTRVCRGANVLPGLVHWKDTERVPDYIAKAQAAFKLVEGDVVVGMDRPWISSGFKVAPVKTADEGSLLVQRVARLRAADGVPSSFIYELMRLPAFTRHCAPTETTIPHISPNDFRTFEIPRPCDANLRMWADRCRSISQTRLRHEAGLGGVDTLFASLQQRAFRGEL